MAKKKTTIKYQMKQGQKIVHRGITNDPVRRESEHQKEYPGATLKQVGRKTTREGALRWEREGGKRSYKQ